MIGAASEETEAGESATACILFWLPCVQSRFPYYRRISVQVPFIISFRHNFVKCWLISGRPPPPESQAQSGPNNPDANLAAKLPYHKGRSAGSSMNLPCSDCNSHTFLTRWHLIGTHEFMTTFIQKIMTLSGFTFDKWPSLRSLLPLVINTLMFSLYFGVWCHAQGHLVLGFGHVVCRNLS